MFRFFKWTVGLLVVAFVLLGVVFQLTTTPEERAALRAEREQRYAAAENSPKSGGTILTEVAQAVAASAAADTLTFGKPTVKSEYGIVTVLVEATNRTDRQVTCMLTATFKRGDTILSAPTGAVNEIPPGGTRTAQLMSTDSVSSYDSVKLEASACF